MLENLEKSPLAPFLQRASLRHYAKGQIILYPEDIVGNLFVIKSGVISMHDYDDAGNQKILHLFGRATLFPMVNFSQQKATASWFYSALTDVETYLIPYAEFKAHMETPEGLECFNYVLKQVLGEVHELLLRINSLSKSNSVTKVAATLQFLLKHHADKRRAKWQRISIPTSQQMLADISGLTRESVSLAMKQLQEKNIVRQPAQSIIEVDIAKLEKT